MSNSPLFDKLKRTVKVAEATEHPGAPPADELLEMQQHQKSAPPDTSPGRPGPMPPFRTGPHAPRIVVVGAGLAGLNTAWQLQRQGLSCTIYEASERLGGRILTARDVLGPGVTTELGASFIDTSHEELFGLLREFGLDVYDCDTFDESQSLASTCCIRGTLYSDLQIVQALRPYVERMQQDLAVVHDDISWDNPGQCEALDRISLAEYLDGLGMTGWVYDLLEVAYITEHGLELGDQSALNMLSLVSTAPHDPRVKDFWDLAMAHSDERFVIRGGNERLVEEMARRLQSPIEFGWQMQAVAEHGSGYRLTFQSPGGVVDVDADFVVITVPFSVLRDLTLKVELPPHTRRAIHEMGYGTITKMAAGFTRPVWREQGRSGMLWRESPYQQAFDDSSQQDSQTAALTFYLGGQAGDAAGHGTEEEVIRRTMTGIDVAFPGATAALNGRFVRVHWPGQPFSRGSYICFRPGQWTTVRGAGSDPVDRLHFAGEHCSVQHYGFMNGAAETGRMAAERIAATVGVSGASAS